MLKINIILTLLVFIFLLSSCKKEGETNPVEPGANSTGTFTATINNNVWRADKVRAYKEDNFTRINGEQVLTDPNSVYSSVIVYIDILYLQSPRVYGIGEDGNGFIYNAHAHVDYKLKSNGSINSYKAIYIENFSEVNITSITTNRIEGTFSFRAFLNPSFSDSINVTNGNFSITF